MSGVLNQGALSANRSGRLALSQALGMVPLMVVGAILFLIGAGMSGGIIYSMIVGTFKGGVMGVIFALIFGGGMSVFLFWLGYILGGKRLIDILLGQVRTVEGRVIKFVEPGSRGGRILYFSVDKDNFQIATYGAWKKLPLDGSMVRGYYAPLSRALVNVEPLYTQAGATGSAQGRADVDEDLEELKRLEQEEVEKMNQQKGRSGNRSTSS